MTHYTHLFAATAATALLLGAYTDSARGNRRRCATFSHRLPERLQIRRSPRRDHPPLDLPVSRTEGTGLVAQTDMMGAALDHGMTPAASN